MTSQAEPERMAFTLDWLAASAAREPQLTICDRGHLVVSNNSHWAPTAFTPNGAALICELVARHD